MKRMAVRKWVSYLALALVGLAFGALPVPEMLSRGLEGPRFLVMAPEPSVVYYSKVLRSLGEIDKAILGFRAEQERLPTESEVKSLPTLGLPEGFGCARCPDGYELYAYGADCTDDNGLPVNSLSLDPMPRGDVVVRRWFDGSPEGKVYLIYGEEVFGDERQH